MARKVLAASGISIVIFLAIMVFLVISTKALTDVGAEPDEAEGSGEDYQMVAEFEQAESYQEKKDYKEAEKVYQMIVTDYPDTLDALNAQERLSVLYISWGKDAKAEAALDQLIADYYDSEHIAKAVDHVADEYRRLEQYEKARDLYQYVADQWPEAPHAMNSAVSAAFSNVLLLIHSDEEAAAADEALNNLIVDFSDYQDIAKVVDHVADEYRGLREYKRARELYQYAADQWPQAEHAAESQMGAILCDAFMLIESGDDSGVQSAIDTLMSDFSNHPGMPRMVLKVGEGYFRAASAYGAKGLETEAEDCLARATTVWEKLIADLPDADIIPWAYHSAADAYCYLGEYDTAIEYFQGVITNWPEYGYVWHAKFMIGYIYQRWADIGTVPRSEADAQTKAAYEQVLLEHPDCPAAKVARSWLRYYRKRK